MFGKKIGDPCPKCAAALIRRRRAGLFRVEGEHVAFCARCNAARDIAEEAMRDPNLFPPGFANS